MSSSPEALHTGTGSNNPLGELNGLYFEA
jgi:hypothetical protein